LAVGVMAAIMSGGCVTWLPGTTGQPHPVAHLVPEGISFDRVQGLGGWVRSNGLRPLSGNASTGDHSAEVPSAAVRLALAAQEELPAQAVDPEGVQGAANGSSKSEITSQLRPLHAVQLDIRVAKGRLPDDRSTEMTGALDTVYYTAGADPADFEHPMFIAPPDFCHRPLYFEEFGLERYGESHGILQPAVSAGRFFGNFPMLPYRLIAEPACGCVCTVGPYVPGACGPYKSYLPPLDTRAALAEAAIIAGLVLLIP
jgi:hypothetical protein